MRNALLSLLFLSLNLFVSGQTSWKKLKDHPSFRIFEQLSVNANGDMMGISGLSFYRSIDGGESWEPCLSQPAFFNADHIDGSGSSSRFYVSTNISGIAWTDNLGNSWNNNKFSQTGPNGTGESILSIGTQPNSSKVLVSSIRTSALPMFKLYSSSNDGASYIEMNDIPFPPEEIYFFHDTLIYFASETKGLFKSSAVNAAPVFLNFANEHVVGLALASGELYAAVNDEVSGGQVYQSSDYGKSWAQVGTISNSPVLTDLVYDHISENIIVSSTSGIYKLESGNTWTQLNQQIVGDLTMNDDLFYCGKRLNGIWYGNSDKNQFQEASVDLINSGSSGFVGRNNLIYSFHERFVNVFELASFKDSFQNLYPFIEDETFITVADNDKNDDVWVGGAHHISKSDSNGQFNVIADSTNLAPLDNGTIRRVHPSRLEVGNDGSVSVHQLSQDHIDISYDNGNTWDTLIDGLSARQWLIDDLLATSNKYYISAFTTAGAFAFCSKDKGNTWDTLPKTNSNISLFKFWVDNNDNLYGANNSGIFKFDSIANGWDSLNFDMSNLTGGDVRLFFNQASDLYLLVRPLSTQSNLAGLYFSDDLGNSFSNLGLPTINGETIMFDNLDFLEDGVPVGFTQPWGYSDDSVEGVWYYSTNTILPPFVAVQEYDAGKLDLNPSITVYPNPAKNELNVEGMSGAFEIYSILGQKLIQGVITEPDHHLIDIHILENMQLYTIQVYSENGTVATAKFYKQ
jgi:hypothetical protein